MITEEIEKKVLRKHLARFIVSDVFNLITDEDLLRAEGTNWTYRGTTLTKEQMANLRSAADNFRKSDLWKILKGELIYHGQKKVLDSGTTEYDLLYGKLVVYMTDIIQTKLDKMSNTK